MLFWSKPVELFGQRRLSDSESQIRRTKSTDELRTKSLDTRWT